MRTRLMALLSWACLGLSGAAYAVEPPPIDVSVSPVSGLPGSIVHPTLTLDITGFNLDVLDLDLAFDSAALSFLPSASTVTYNGHTVAFTDLPGFSPGVPGIGGDGLWHERYVSFSLFAVPVSGPLVLTGAFKIADAAMPGAYQIVASGYVTTDPVYEQRDFSGIAPLHVSAVPEPETWLLWLGGIGLLAARRTRRATAV